MMRGERLPKHILIKDYSYMLFIEGTMLLSLFLVCIGKQESMWGKGKNKGSRLPVYRRREQCKGGTAGTHHEGRGNKTVVCQVKGNKSEGVRLRATEGGVLLVVVGSGHWSRLYVPSYS